MPEVLIRQCRFTYSVCRRFTYNKEKIKIQNLKDTGYWRHMHIASTIWKCFNKKSKENCAAGAVTCTDTAEAALKSKVAVVGTLNQEQADELHKTMIRNVQKFNIH